MGTTAARHSPLTADEEAVLRSLGPAMKVLSREFGADLVSEQGMASSEYAVLMFLSEAPDRTLRLSDLAARCQQSLSAVSRTIGRLETAGLARREQAACDARGYNAVLTDAGLLRLEEAWPTHVRSVRRHLFDNLQGVDLHALAASLERIAAKEAGCLDELASDPSCD
jgi:DNA-binding MarR family transcriptional regulator